MIKAFIVTFFLYFGIAGPLYAGFSGESCFGDGDVTLMLHMNGADASTTFKDSQHSSPHTMTANGNAQIDTAQSKFGGASGLFDGTGDYLSTPDSADWYLGTNAFTIDLWVRFNAIGSANQTFVGQMVGFHNFWTFQEVFDNTICPGGLETSDCLRFIVWDTSKTVEVMADWTPSTLTWYHVAVTRDSSGNYRFFVNGTQQGTTQTDTSAVPDFTQVLTVGASYDGTTVYVPFNGWIDELRIVKGKAIWTSSFTAPSNAYVECEKKVRIS